VEVLSRREGVTLFMVLLAAFKCVLARHSGQTDVVVGTPIAGRTRTEVEGLVGFFVNTLVLRSDLSGNPSFRELLKRVRQAALEGYAHQDLPFERLVEELEPQREAGRNPLFQVMFNLVEFDRAGLRFADLTVSRLRNPEPESKFDLTLYAAPSSEGIELVAVYDAASYSAQHIDEVLVQLELLLEQAVAQPDLRVGQYSLLSPRAERVLAEPGTSLDRGWHGSVTERFSIQAAEHPDRVAIADAVREWTYRELETASNRLAHYLRDEGIRPGDVVALHAHRGGTVVWALLGVMKAGAAFLVLDSAYPAAALRERLRQARPRAFVDCGDGTGQSDLLDGWEEAPRLRVDLPRDPTQTGAWSSKPAVPPQGVVEPDQLAYVAFTSGSSGGAKGILGTQRPLSHFFEWHTRHFDLVAVDRFSLLSGLSHDPFLRDVFTPLWLGATLCIPDAMDLAQGRLGDWMAAQRVTVAHLTPSLARLLEGSGSDGLASLRYVFFGGETLRYSDVARLHAVAGGATCVNYYGATETPQAMGFFVVPPSPGVAETAARSECVPLGRGIGAVRLLVLNGVGQRAGLGEIGEIHVQTPYLAVGYLGDETQTRERFVRDPFQPTTGERLYRTGDLGRYTLEGDVVFTGRADDQVKIRGVRVEPAEVEAALLQHPQLAQAAVTAHDPAPGDSRLVAYVVSRGERAPEADVLRSFLADRLPQGMIPTSIVALTALPLTPNGKLDRRALPPPNGHGHGHGRPSYVAPRSPVEQELASLWTDLLEIPDVGVHDDFFALGGHSLLGTQLVSRVRDLLGVEIPLRALFENPTLADLAAAVTQIFLETADETEREPLAAGLGDEDKVTEESNL
jgi:amino acid adenylation domain-containing protein